MTKKTPTYSVWHAANSVHAEKLFETDWFPEVLTLMGRYLDQVCMAGLKSGRVFHRVNQFQGVGLYEEPMPGVVKVITQIWMETSDERLDSVDVAVLNLRKLPAWLLNDKQRAAIAKTTTDDDRNEPSE